MMDETWDMFAREPAVSHFPAADEAAFFGHNDQDKSGASKAIVGHRRKYWFVMSLGARLVEWATCPVDSSLECPSARSSFRRVFHGEDVSYLFMVRICSIDYFFLPN